MNLKNLVITGIGVVSPYGLGKDVFWKGLEYGKNCAKKPKELKYTALAAVVNDEAVRSYLGQKGLRNIDRSALMLMAAAGMAIEDAEIKISASNTDRIGVATGTTFSHIDPIIRFDREVFKEGINFASPALFPTTVLNAPSSQISIRYNIQGFNTTVSTGFTSSLEALKYASNSIETGHADIVLAGGVEPLSSPLLFGLRKLGYLAGIGKKARALSCPFDARRNGPVPGEGAGMIVLERQSPGRSGGSTGYARILGLSSCFDPRGVTKVFPKGDCLEAAVRSALEQAGIVAEDVDYISSCANSTIDLDKVEVKVLKRVFGSKLDKIPVSSIKSMIGETFSASGILQIASCVGAMLHKRVPPTINYEKPDRLCDIDCVPNASRKKNVDIALVVSSGPGGYNSACILEKI